MRCSLIIKWVAFDSVDKFCQHNNIYFLMMEPLHLHDEGKVELEFDSESDRERARKFYQQVMRSFSF